MLRSLSAAAPSPVVAPLIETRAGGIVQARIGTYHLENNDVWTL